MPSRGFFILFFINFFFLSITAVPLNGSWHQVQYLQEPVEQQVLSVSPVSPRRAPGERLTLFSQVGQCVLCRSLNGNLSPSTGDVFRAAEMM